MTPLRVHDLKQEEETVLLTLPEAARELRCSRSHLYRILSGKHHGPPLPAFHLGRKVFIRKNQLQAWIRSLEDMERESRYASGFFGITDMESIAGA